MIELSEDSLNTPDPLVVEAPYQVIKIVSPKRPHAARLGGTALRTSASTDAPRPAFYLYLDAGALDGAPGDTPPLAIDFADGSRALRPVTLGFDPALARQRSAEKQAQIARRLKPGVTPAQSRTPGPDFDPFRLEAKGDHVSAHPFEHLLPHIDAFDTSFGIDIGSGAREDPVWNIANVDIFDYPSTDIIAFGDRIPVADGAFDFAICLAVLEHVPNPFLVAREIQRIVRPGGQILVNVPFLQHLHGYPHHYFNMTPDGIEQLFPDCALQRHFQDFSCHPIRTLRQVIADYARGLAARDPALARKFLSLKLSDIAGIEARQEAEFLNLPEATMQMIAHSNFSLFQVR
jgi:SAM-dependent methyltransferase